MSLISKAFRPYTILARDNAKVAYFPIYHLRHVFCTRLSWVAPDAVVQRATRHSSPETKRHYQLGWWSRCGRTSRRRMRRSTADARYYIFMTVSLLPKKKKK